jgi:hypothetical protein
MEQQQQAPKPRTVTLEDDGVLRLTDAEIRHIGGIRPGDRFEFEVVDDESFTFKKVKH